MNFDTIVDQLHRKVLIMPSLTAELENHISALAKTDFAIYGTLNNIIERHKLRMRIAERRSLQGLAWQFTPSNTNVKDPVGFH